MEILKYVGLVLFAVPFVLSGIAHLRFVDAMTGYAEFKGIPAAKTSVVVTGLVLVAAPILVILGIIPQIALAALALFLLVTAFKMHDFWNAEGDAKQGEQINFNKNIGLAGAALALIALL
jgi:putative oxidoreductase